MKLLPFLAAAAFLWTSEAGAQKEVVALTPEMAEEAPTEPPPLTNEETTERAEEVRGDSLPSVIEAECPEGHVCVPFEDMATISQIIRERKCLESTEPLFDVSNVTIIVDEEGRIFYQGDPEDLTTPFIVKMQWCHYNAVAGGPIKVTAAMKEPSVWGFRFRPKAYMGYALLTPFFDGNKFDDGIDAGLMLDFFHYKFVNLNAAVGFRSLGAGFGVDITKNFGGYLGYGMMWKALLNPRQQPLHNAVLGFDFAF